MRKGFSPVASMASLAERRKAGERFYLALVDVLLKKPAYYELRKTEVKVGFLPDCDWTLPWTSMGLDILTDSRRFDSTFPENQCESVSNSPLVCAPQIGKRDKEPFFLMKFHAELGWRVECGEGHGCAVVQLPQRRLHYFREAFRLTDPPNAASSISKLDDGDAFEFLWPFVSLILSSNGFSVPLQRLQFVFVACHEDDFPPQHHLDGRPPHLLSLPKEVLARIASNLEPYEFLNLTKVGRIFTSTAMAGQIPWRTVKIDASFDSLRVAHLASTEAVRVVKCERIWSRELMIAFYREWRPVLSQGLVKVLDVEDPQLLTYLGVPPNLRELRFRVQNPCGSYWDALRLLKFPASISRVCIQCIHRGDDEDAELSPNVFFATFSGVTEVHFRDVNFTPEEWEDVPARSLERITSLFAEHDLYICSIPFARLTNLVFLHLRGVEWSTVRQLSFPNLEYAAVELDDIERPDSTAILLTNATKLRFFHVGTNPGGPPRLIPLAELPALHPKLQYLYVKGARVTLTDVRALLRKMPGLLDVEFSALSSRQSLPRSSFPQYHAATLRWTWYNRQVGTGYDFIFSRITDEEREEVMRPLNREILAWQ